MTTRDRGMLEKTAKLLADEGDHGDRCVAAAIRRTISELARLRAALEKIHVLTRDTCSTHPEGGHWWDGCMCQIADIALAAYREATKEAGK